MFLNVSVKAMNYAIGENRLVATRLVFGVIPCFPIISTNIPTRKERMEIPAAVQAEINATIAE